MFDLELRDFALELAGRTEYRFWQVVDEDYRFPAEFWASLTESGLLGIALPEEFGGLGKGLFDLTLAVEAVAEGGAGMEGGSLFLSGPVFGLLWAFLCFTRGRPVPEGTLSVHRTSRAVIECARSVPFSADGDLMCRGARFEVEVMPGALSLIS